MTDEEKIAWFNGTLAWVKSFGSSGDAREYVEDCGSAAYDLYFSFIEQYAKIEKAILEADILELNEPVSDHMISLIRSNLVPTKENK